MIEILKRFAWATRALGALGLVLFGVVVARATEPTPVPRVIHYEGYLEKDGTPVNGKVDITLRLDDGDADGGNASDPPFDFVAGQVAVTGGKFSVDIDVSSSDASFVFTKPNQVYLTATVNGVPLTGRQRIYPVPYAVRAAEAGDFTISGTATAKDMSVTGGLAVTGPFSLDKGLCFIKSRSAGSCPAGFVEQTLSTGPYIVGGVTDEEVKSLGVGVRGGGCSNWSRDVTGLNAMVDVGCTPGAIISLPHGATIYNADFGSLTFTFCCR